MHKATMQIKHLISCAQYYNSGCFTSNKKNHKITTFQIWLLHDLWYRCKY